MGHYASEMRSDAEQKQLDKEDADRKARVEAGYRSISIGQYSLDSLLQCAACASLVVDWKKHAAWHIAMEKNA